MAELKASKQRLEPVLGLTREVHRTTTLLRQMLRVKLYKDLRERGHEVAFLKV